MTGLGAAPWVVKPVYGFLSDTVPIFGYRRRSYLIICGLLGKLLAPMSFVGFVATSPMNLFFASHHFAQTCHSNDLCNAVFYVLLAAPEAKSYEIDFLHEHMRASARSAPMHGCMLTVQAQSHGRHWR